MPVNTGKILFIDDKYTEVKRAISNLIKSGMAVQYWNGKDDKFPDVQNIRVVVLDIDLSGKGSRAQGETYYALAAKALAKVPGPFIVILMANDYTDDDPGNFEGYYCDHMETPLCGLVSKKGLTKQEELGSKEILKTLIDTTIENDVVLNLLINWENVVDKAQDLAFKDVVTEGIKCTVVSIVKSLCRDFGEDSAARELVMTLMRLISRRVSEPSEFNGLSELVKKVYHEIPEDLEDYPRKEHISMNNKLMYYQPNGEKVWTGDIYKISGSKKYDDYAIVITPVCDLVQNKTDTVLTCIGFPVLETCFGDTSYPPYLIDGTVKKTAQRGDPDKTVTLIKERYIFGKQKMPESLFFLWNFEEGGNTFGLCFNFNNIQTIEKAKIEKLPKVSRLDSPYVQDMLEKYGRFASRVGTPEINLSPSKLGENVVKNSVVAVSASRSAASTVMPHKATDKKKA